MSISYVSATVEHVSVIQVAMFLQRTAICFGFVVLVFQLISLLVARLFCMILAAVRSLDL